MQVSLSLSLSLLVSSAHLGPQRGLHESNGVRCRRRDGQGALLQVKPSLRSQQRAGRKGEREHLAEYKMGMEEMEVSDVVERRWGTRKVSQKREKNMRQSQGAGEEREGRQLEEPSSIWIIIIIMIIMPHSTNGVATISQKRGQAETKSSQGKKNRLSDNNWTVNSLHHFLALSQYRDPRKRLEVTTPPPPEEDEPSNPKAEIM